MRRAGAAGSLSRALRLGLLVACLLRVPCALAGPAAAGPEAAPLTGFAPAIAPDFTRPDLHGSPVHLYALRGQLVLLNFWATWCAPCLEEVPRFALWQQQYGPAGLRIIGVSMDDEAGAVQRFLAGHPVSYPILMGDVELARSFGGVLGLPLSYLIDPQGNIVARFRGEPALARMEARIRELLPGAGS